MARLPLDDARLADARIAHPLAIGMPVIRRLLVDEAAEAGLLVAVSDAAGQLLWVEGDPVLRAKAENMHFLPGADWSEESAGTNAPGTALALGAAGADLRPGAPAASGHGLELLRGADPRARHRAPSWVCWTSAAAPRWRDRRRSPWSEPRSPRSRPSCGSAGSMAPYGLAGDRHEPASAAPRLEVLGRRSARFSHPGTTTELSLRHSEIVLLLAESPDGLSSAELGVALSDDDQADGHHPRRAVAAAIPARPGAPAVTPVPATPADLRRRRPAGRSPQGRLRSAVARYRGPVLPASVRPGGRADPGRPAPPAPRSAAGRQRSRRAAGVRRHPVRSRRLRHLVAGARRAPTVVVAAARGDRAPRRSWTSTCADGLRPAQR